MTTNAELAAALTSLRPGAEWFLGDDDLASLVWLDPVQTRPADADIIGEAERIAATPPSPAERLAAALGMSVDDLRAALAAAPA